MIKEVLQSWNNYYTLLGRLSVFHFLYTVFLFEKSRLASCSEQA